MWGIPRVWHAGPQAGGESRPTPRAFRTPRGPCREGGSMRFVRPSVVICAIAGLIAVSAASAWATATDQANGQGQTPSSAALGFNAQSDLSGNLDYNADPNGANAGFSAHCNDYTSFVLRYTKVGNYPLVKVTASCADKDGNTVYL